MTSRNVDDDASRGAHTGQLRDALNPVDPLSGDTGRVVEEARERISRWLNNETDEAPLDEDLHALCQAAALLTSKDAALLRSETENARLKGALERVKAWINTYVPIGTTAATTILGVVLDALREEADHG